MELPIDPVQWTCRLGVADSGSHDLAHDATQAQAARQPLHGASRHDRALSRQLPPDLFCAAHCMLTRQTRSISDTSTSSRRDRAQRLCGSRSSAVCRRYPDGATCKTLQIGSTPKASRCRSMNVLRTSVGGRAPPGKTSARQLQDLVGSAQFLGFALQRFHARRWWFQPWHRYRLRRA